VVDGSGSVRPAGELTTFPMQISVAGFKGWGKNEQGKNKTGGEGKGKREGTGRKRDRRDEKW